MREKLQVPLNIPLRWELWRGFGKMELIRTLVCATVLTIFIALLCAILTAWEMKIVAVFAFILFFVVFSSVFTKIDNNRSVYDYLLHSWRFRHTQQKFFYKSGKEVIYLAQEDD